MPTDVIKLAKLEADVGNIKESVNRMTGYLERSAQERTVQYTETVRQLAVLQVSVDSYQKNCTEDRKDYETRIQTMETYQNGQRGVVAFISAIVGILVAGISWAVKAMH